VLDVDYPQDMSYNKEQVGYLEDVRADLDTFLQAKKWNDAQALIDGAKEQGYDITYLTRQYRLAHARVPGIRGAANGERSRHDGEIIQSHKWD
jgi:hypothetical protein